MNILLFHRVLMTLAIAFCAGFAVRELVIGIRTGDGLALGLAFVFGVATAGLYRYLRWWLRTKATSLRPHSKP